MKVYALIGKSGTGKSFQAINLCRQLNIQYIIDDGLLIGEANILAGTSAKRQATKIGAIKTALFTDDNHRSEVLKKIKELSPESMLIIGTSQAMVEKIRSALLLPEPERTIYIEDITTFEDRMAADKQRHELGKHVIPVPTMELKREFSGYFMDPLRIFRGFGSKGSPERSVVRPTYSYLGEYSISDRVISDIVFYLGEKLPGIHRVNRVGVEKASDGIRITVSVTMNYGINIMEAAEAMQRKIAEETGEMTAFNIEAVNIEIRGLK